MVHDHEKLLKEKDDDEDDKAIPVQTAKGVMTATPGRKGVYNITSIQYQTYLSRRNAPNVLPYQKKCIMLKKPEHVTLEYDIYNQKKKSEKLDESFDEEVYLEEAVVRIKDFFQMPYRSNLVATSAGQMVITPKSVLEKQRRKMKESKGVKAEDQDDDSLKESNENIFLGVDDYSFTGASGDESSMYGAREFREGVFTFIMNMGDFN